MSGVKGMHKAWRGSGAYADAVRARIKAGGIAKRLSDHVAGKIDMKPTQITAAVALLKKVVPDLSSAELVGADGSNLFPDKVEIELVRPDGS